MSQPIRGCGRLGYSPPLCGHLESDGYVSDAFHLIIPRRETYSLVLLFDIRHVPDEFVGPIVP